jgi:hypothetical protein
MGMAGCADNIIAGGAGVCGDKYDGELTLMKHSFSVKMKYQLLSLKEGIYIIMIIPIVGLLYTVFPMGVLIGRLDSKVIPREDYGKFLLFSLCYITLLFIPSLILSIIYFQRNRKTLLEFEGNQIHIKQGSNFYDYNTDDIISAKKYLGIYYKNEIDKRGRWAATWSGYGYIKIEFKDGNIFFFTSLMLAPKEFDLIQTEVKYSFFPIFNKKSYKHELHVKKEMKKLEMKFSQEKYEEFKARFSNYENDKLEEKILDSDKYSEEAITAAKRILEERKSNKSCSPPRADP